jgi:hypothetical protein
MSLMVAMSVAGIAIAVGFGMREEYPDNSAALCRLHKAISRLQMTIFSLMTPRGLVDEYHVSAEHALPGCIATGKHVDCTGPHGWEADRESGRTVGNSHCRIVAGS